MQSSHGGLKSLKPGQKESSGGEGYDSITKAQVRGELPCARITCAIGV